MPVRTAKLSLIKEERAIALNKLTWLPQRNLLGRTMLQGFWTHPNRAPAGDKAAASHWFVAMAVEWFSA